MSARRSLPNVSTVIITIVSDTKHNGFVTSGGLRRDTGKVPGGPVVTLDRCTWIKNNFIKLLYLSILYLIVRL
jgi:hypothetical protein